MNPLRTKKPVNSNYILIIFTLGLLTIATQIVLLREFLSIFYGNELVIGMILTNWMLLTGLGAYIGRISEKYIRHLVSSLYFLVVLAILPLLLVFLMFYLRDIVFIPGTMVDLFRIFLSSFLLLLPFCVLSGFNFTLVSYIVSRDYDKNLISKAYSWESTGSIAGGILFNLVLIWFLETFESLILLAVVVFGILLYVSFRWKYKVLMYILPVLMAGMVVLNFSVNLDRLTRSFLFSDQQIEYFKSTPYGNIAVTEDSGQLNFYENNLLLFTSDQPTQNEETVHYTMLQHKNPAKVLLLSGGTPGVIRELLKYPVSRIDYVEINPWLIRSVANYSEIYDTSAVNVINKDARLYLKKAGENYDVALINLPEPSTVQMNRFYTRQFYEQLKDNLSKDAVIGFSVSGSSNYLSEESRQLYASLHNTLTVVFEHLIVIPGNKNYFIASDAPLTYQITEAVEERGLKTEYVNKYYIQDDLLKQRAEKILNTLSSEIDINRDFRPVTYLLDLKQWVSHFNFNYWVPLILAGLLALYFIIHLHPVNLGMFSAGFAGASIEVLLLVTFQILYGYVYNLVGIIVTVFMAGLAFGTFYRERIIRKTSVRNFYRIQLVLGCFAVLLPLIFILLKNVAVPSVLIHAIFIVLMFVTSALVGMVFSLASQLRLKKLVTIASDIYSVDLLGAGIGSFLATVYLIPVLGILNVCLVIGGLSLLSGLMTVVRLRK
ncbi:MAG: fused MFS/spermidine synthase [Bacteroidales bacterium]|nr:fused MFS/spermidine synthase [Bacteroidales bacterium]